jgi:hypothetical protein
MDFESEQFLRKQAWDYFTTHASQRISTFNFYIVLSSLTATTYAAAWKQDSNLQEMRGLIAFLLCLFAFVFWKLDQRNRVLIRNAERALVRFEAAAEGDPELKVFTNEMIHTHKSRCSRFGWKWVLFWQLQLSYSDCFNTVFLVFACIGLVGTTKALSPYIHPIRWLLPLHTFF